MRTRQVGFLTLMLVANAGVLAWFAITVVVNQSPRPVPLVVTAAHWPSPLPAHADANLLPAPTQPPTAAPTELGQPEPTAAAPAATDAPPPVVAEPPPTAAPELAPDVISLEDLPAAAAVSGVVGHRQSLPLSCESRSAADWAAFFGVAIDELEFLSNLPASDDPDRGFVGDVRGAWGQTPPNAYGVHAGPVAKLLTAYGVRATSGRYLKWAVVQREIAAGRPVLVWVVGRVAPGRASEIYTAADGRQTVVARFEHTVIVIGYTADTVTVVDGAQVYTRPLDVFLESWGTLRNMAVTYDGV